MSKLLLFCQNWKSTEIAIFSIFLILKGHLFIFIKKASYESRVVISIVRFRFQKRKKVIIFFSLGPFVQILFLFWRVFYWRNRLEQERIHICPRMTPLRHIVLYFLLLVDFRHFDKRQIVGCSSVNIKLFIISFILKSTCITII